MLHIYQKIRNELFTDVENGCYNTVNFTRKDGYGFMARGLSNKEEIFG